MCDIHHHAPCQSTCTKHMHAEIHTITHHVGAVANKVFHFPRRRRLLDSVYSYRVYSASKYRTIEPSTTMTSCGISDDVQLSTFNERAKHVIWAFYQISVKHAPVIRCPHVNSPHLPGHSVNRISRPLSLSHCKVTLLRTVHFHLPQILTALELFAALLNTCMCVYVHCRGIVFYRQIKWCKLIWQPGIWGSSRSASTFLWYRALITTLSYCAQLWSCGIVLITTLHLLRCTLRTLMQITNLFPHCTLPPTLVSSLFIKIANTKFSFSPHCTCKFVN